MVVEKEVWTTECKFSGAWRGGKRFCTYYEGWFSKEECENCRLERKKVHAGMKRR